MKKLILALLMCGAVIAQDLPNSFQTGNGMLWADSLWQDYTGVTDSTHNADTLDLNFQYDWISFASIDTGATYTDSLVLEYGIPTYTWDLNFNRYKRSDTTWHVIPFMRDSTWTNVNIIAASNSVTTYMAYVGNYEVIRVRQINAEIVADRVYDFRAILTRKIIR